MTLLHVVEDEAEGVDGVDADVADGAAGGEGGVGDPGAAGELCGVVELGVGGAGFADLTGGDARADLLDGVGPAVVVRDPEELAGALAAASMASASAAFEVRGFSQRTGFL